jgi:biopolymer transport protein ExbD
MAFKAPQPVRMELNLAPMVDVMMCLIIFFILASKLVDAESREIKLPYAVAAKEIERSELGQRVVINVRPALEQGADAEYVVTGWDGQNIIERILLPGDVEPYLKMKATRPGVILEELRCVIRADQGVRYQDVEVVLKGCGMAKIQHIIFSAKAGEDPEDA